MHTGSRVLIGLLLLSAAALVAAEETAAPPVEAPASLPQGSREAATGNARQPEESSPESSARAADVEPTSWSNVKALWG